MEVIVTRTFLKQLKNCPPYIQESARAVLESLEAANDLSQIPDIKKLKGYLFYYRICIGDYRSGMEHRKPQIIVMTILHRGTIYKKFPPKN